MEGYLLVLPESFTSACSGSDLGVRTVRSSSFLSRFLGH